MSNVIDFIRKTPPLKVEEYIKHPDIVQVLNFFDNQLDLIDLDCTINTEVTLYNVTLSIVSNAETQQNVVLIIILCRPAIVNVSVINRHETPLLTIESFDVVPLFRQLFASCSGWYDIKAKINTLENEGISTHYAYETIINGVCVRMGLYSQ